MKDDRSAGRSEGVSRVGKTMTKKKIRGRGLFIAGIVLAVLAAGIFGIFAYKAAAARGNFALRVSEMGSSGSTPATIEGLRDAIAKYENRIEETVQTAAQAGIYWKILAVRYMDRRMYSEALDAFERAISYFPEDPSLLYFSGVCAAIVAKSSLDFGASGRNISQERYFSLAEAAQLRSISLDPAYARPRYALGVLYVFELGKPEDAIKHLETYLELESKSVDGMFVLARAYYMSGAYQKAVDLYDRILGTTRDSSKKLEAESNKKAALDALYG